MNPVFENVTIIGVGLIGGSLGMAMCGRGLAGRVTGVDIDADNLKAALELEAIHEAGSDLESAAAGADLVVVAVPVGLTVEIIKKIAPVLKTGCVVTDVGSTKSMIVREVEEIMPPDTHFVGGHPMTGAETAGVGGADRYLFENAVYVLTPSGRTDPGALQRVETLVRAVGAKVIKLDPAEHDIMVAAVSHLPHLIATSLVNTAGELEHDHAGLLMLAAGGFRDTTRVASGHPMMWRDICLTNKESILQVLDSFSRVLGRTREMIAACDAKALEEGFNRARELRKKMPSKMKGYLPNAYEIVVTVPDKPGVIANLAVLLGEAGINIIDIEIMRVREGEGGTIRLAFAGEADQDRAVAIYRANGITVKKR